MLPETLLVPTNSYLALMSTPSTRNELHIAAQRAHSGTCLRTRSPTAYLIQRMTDLPEQPGARKGLSLTTKRSMHALDLCAAAIATAVLVATAVVCALNLTPRFHSYFQN
jgi:hypothetical protein